MKLLLIQLSDMHFENTEQTHSIKVDKMISAIKANADAEECIIVISGDLAAKGKKTDYQFVKGFIIALLRALNENGYICISYVLPVNNVAKSLLNKKAFEPVI